MTTTSKLKKCLASPDPKRKKIKGSRPLQAPSKCQLGDVDNEEIPRWQVKADASGRHRWIRFTPTSSSLSSLIAESSMEAKEEMGVPVTFVVMWVRENVTGDKLRFRITSKLASDLQRGRFSTKLLDGAETMQYQIGQPYLYPDRDFNETLAEGDLTQNPMGKGHLESSPSFLFFEGDEPWHVISGVPGANEAEKETWEWNYFDGPFFVDAMTDNDMTKEVGVLDEGSINWSNEDLAKENKKRAKRREKRLTHNKKYGSYEMTKPIAGQLMGGVHWGNWVEPKLWHGDDLKSFVLKVHRNSDRVVDALLLDLTGARFWAWWSHGTQVSELKLFDDQGRPLIQMEATNVSKEMQFPILRNEAFRISTQTPGEIRYIWGVEPDDNEKSDNGGISEPLMIFSYTDDSVESTSPFWFSHGLAYRDQIPEKSPEIRELLRFWRKKNPFAWIEKGGILDPIPLPTEHGEVGAGIKFLIDGQALINPMREFVMDDDPLIYFAQVVLHREPILEIIDGLMLRIFVNPTISQESSSEEESEEEERENESQEEENISESWKFEEQQQEVTRPLSLRWWRRWAPV